MKGIDEQQPLRFQSGMQVVKCHVYTMSRLIMDSVAAYQLLIVIAGLRKTDKFCCNILHFKTSTQLHTFTFPTPAHLQFDTSISSSPQKQQTSKIKTFKQNFKGVQNYVTNEPVIQQPHSTNLFKIYLTLYFNYRLSV
jgi:hypothetical protein